MFDPASGTSRLCDFRMFLLLFGATARSCNASKRSNCRFQSHRTLLQRSWTLKLPPCCFWRYRTLLQRSQTLQPFASEAIGRPSEAPRRFISPPNVATAAAGATSHGNVSERCNYCQRLEANPGAKWKYLQVTKKL